MKPLQQPRNKGFTLIEMLVIAPIVILTIGAFLTVIINMTGEVLASRASNNLSYNVQDTLIRIEQDVKMSNGFLATNNVLGTNQGFNDDATAFTNIGGASGTSLILNAVATGSNPVSANSSYVFLKDKPNACSNAQNNAPFTYNIVYFVKNETLFRRTIMPTNYTDTTNTVCSVPWQQPSCSPTYMDAQSGSIFCRTRDVELAKGVSSSGFLVQYFNSESTNVVNAPANTAPAVADRTAALLSVTTIGVSINAKQSAAGRNVERSATLRASRLESNASGIAAITTDGIPAAPTVSSSTGQPTTVTFSWPKVNTATGYTFEYKVGAGSWNFGFQNQPTQTFTVTTATHQDIVSARVTAINAAGSSAFGTSNATVPLWTGFTLENTWQNYDGTYTSAGYTKTANGLIVLKGMVRAGSGVIATLPAGYRPASQIMFENATNSAGGRLDITAGGAVTMAVGSNAWFSLDGIAFMPSGTTYSPVTFSSGWTNYSAAWQSAGYMIDTAGRVQLAGLIRSGTVTNGTVMFTLPSGYQPDAYTHILNDIDNGAGHYAVDSSGGVVAKGYTNGFSSLQGMFYPAGRVTGTTCTTQWCALSLQNSWVWYGTGFATPLYTKGTDNVVLLKGLIKGGTATTAVVTTLPAGYCPKERHLLSTIAFGNWSRIDIIPNGNGTCNVVPGTGASTVWLSLDGLRFVAEP